MKVNVPPKAAPKVEPKVAPKVEQAAETIVKEVPIIKQKASYSQLFLYFLLGSCTALFCSGYYMNYQIENQLKELSRETEHLHRDYITKMTELQQRFDKIKNK